MGFGGTFFRAALGGVFARFPQKSFFQNHGGETHFFFGRRFLAGSAFVGAGLLGFVGQKNVVWMAPKLALAADYHKAAATEADIRHARNLSADFKSLLDAREIPLTVQSALAQLDLRQLSEYSLVDDTKAEVRDFLKVELLLDKDAGVELRILSAKLLDIWEVAKHGHGGGGSWRRRMPRPGSPVFRRSCH